MDKKRILIVDDEKEITNIIQRFLTYKGYDTDVAFTGESALEKIEEKMFDLVLLDIMLPGMDGYEVCRRIKIDRRYNLIPILMLTVKDTEADRIKGLRTGADGYMSKPFDLDELEKYMEEIIEKNKVFRDEIGILQKIEFKIQSQFEYLEKVNNLIAQIFHYTDLEPEKIWSAKLALNEIGANAVEHGNKSDENKAVKISYTLYKDKIVFEIEDEGEGFDYEGIPDPTADENVYSERGRGLFLAKQSMDEVEFLNDGRTVRLVKYIKRG